MLTEIPNMPNTDITTLACHIQVIGDHLVVCQRSCAGILRDQPFGILPRCLTLEAEAMAVGLPDFTLTEHYSRQWTALGFSPAGHPIAFCREELTAHGVLPCAGSQEAKPGSRVTLAGLVLRPHRPSTAGGTVFFTLEDEGGMAQVTVFPEAYRRLGSMIYTSLALAITGIVTKHGDGMFLAADSGKTLS